MPIIDERLADKVIHGWRILDTKQHVNDYPCGVPDLDEIDHVIRTAFFASIQKEESQFITFGIVFLPTHKDAKPRHLLSPLNAFVEFSHPEEMSVEALKKLAGAVDDKASALVVEKRNDKFWITGIAPFGRRPSPLGTTSSVYPRPEALSITARSPGSLIISRGDSVIGRFIAGEFVVAQPTPFHSKALGQDLIGRVSLHDAFREFSNEYWTWYAPSLEHLLQSASGRGHGGIIIWVPAESIDSALQLTTLGHRLKNFSSIHDVLLEFMRHHKATNQTSRKILEDSRGGRGQTDTKTSAENVVYSMAATSQKNKLITLLDTLAQIACVDGATIIDEFFAPKVFGARLQGPEWQKDIFPGPNLGISSREKILRNRYGTRHNSAIDFVGAVPGAIAFVLSQDGPVRAITRRGEVIYIWPDCLSTMFLE